MSSTTSFDIPPTPAFPTLTQSEWESHIERAYDVLPAWWWTPHERNEAYQHYRQRQLRLKYGDTPHA